ncbi:MAG TPA: VOC family protein, partial [Blastocatellia bacterium]|nr:VOC family protein [Blastocatellia bacterium]
MLNQKRDYLPGLIPCAFLILLALSSAALPASQSPNTFPLELDHVFIWVTKGAPEAKALEDAGLQMLGEISKHTGQGTASRLFVFENAYLELIWIDDDQAASRNAARTAVDMVVRANWKQTKASPFGVGLHRIAGVTNPIPFQVIEYWSDWMKANTSIQFARVVTNDKEPMYFVLPEYLAVPDAAAREKVRQTNPNHPWLVKHRLGLSKLTSARITTTE